MQPRKFSILVLLLLVFVSCGTATTSTSHTTYAVSLPTILHVVRPATLNNVPRYERTIRDVATVQALYKAANALPAWPYSHGVVNCPADLAIEYQLSFLKGSTLIQTANVFPTGCSSVQIGQGKTHIYALTEEFSTLLAKTIGLPSLVPHIV